MIIVFANLFLSIAATGLLEMHWGRISLGEWWQNEQFWVISSVSAHLFALFQGLLEVLGGIETSFTVTSKGGTCGSDSENGNRRLYDFYLIRTALLIPPLTLVVLNTIGIAAGLANAVSNGYESLGLLFGKLFFAFWVIFYMYPLIKGLVGSHDRVPTIVIIWSITLASLCLLLWVRINSSHSRSDGPVLEICGLDCD